MTQTATIYGLVCDCHPEAGVRYVGATTRLPSARLREHLKDSNLATRGHLPVSKWVKKHNKRVRAVVLAVCPPEALEDAERRAIAQYRAITSNLLNVSEGGIAPGTPVSPEQAARISDSLRRHYRDHPNPFKGRTHTEESKARMRWAALGRPVTAVAREKISARQRGRKVTDESRRRMSQAQRGENNPMYGKVGHWAGKTRDPRVVQALRDANRGENARSAKLKEADVRHIRTLHAEGAGAEQVAQKYGVSGSAIRDIVKGRTWTHVE